MNFETYFPGRNFWKYKKDKLFGGVGVKYCFIKKKQEKKKKKKFLSKEARKLF